jgi:glycosyltransferase involved in cell wall biosynthesis
MPPSVEVIIPTLCGLKKAHLLKRAIDNIVAQEGVKAVPIVVVNGARFDPALLAQLKARSDIRLIQLEAGGLFQARRVGCEAVRTEFFAIHDDDDILLPGALARRLDVFRTDEKTDWVVTNGTFVWPDREEPFIPDVAAVRRDPYGTLLDHCWLCSAGNLFRTFAITPDIFDAVRSMDLTYIAFRLLAEGKKLALIDEATFKYFYYPDSLSKENEYNLQAAKAIHAMMQLRVPGWVRRGLGRKYRRAMHDVASHYCGRGAVREAWAAHLRSVAGLPEFFHYIAFTRKLLMAARAADTSTRAG